MRKIFFFLSVLAVFIACDDDDNGFDVPVEFRKISFEPVPGGAVMRYRLLENMDVFAVRASYRDAYGRNLVREGTYLDDTLLLNGFTEKRIGEPVVLTFLNKNMVESAPVEMTFDTEDAATVALFDNLTVNPFWGGFNVTYSSPNTVEGTVHVFYVGINPHTQQEDHILVGSFPIVEGGDTLNFELKQALDELNVVIRTDDFDGNIVKTQIYEKIDALAIDTLRPDQFKFIYPDFLSIEDEPHQIGLKYLFDGQKKGANYRKNYQQGDLVKYGTWIAGPGAFGERFIIDFGEPKVPAMLRGDVFLYHGYSYPYKNQHTSTEVDMFAFEMWSGAYTTRLPCKIKVYATNAENPRTVDLAECVKLYELDDKPNWSNFYNNAWCRYSDNTNNALHYTKAFKNLSDQAFNEAEPICLEMKCNYLKKAFRYVFFIVEDTYSSGRWANDLYEDNPREYISFDELEVFVKKENN